MKPKLRGLHNEDRDNVSQMIPGIFKKITERGVYCPGKDGTWTITDKEDQKGEKKVNEEKIKRNLNIPDPDRRKVSTFSSDKVSPILRPETKGISRLKRAAQPSALCCHERTLHCSTLNSA